MPVIPSVPALPADETEALPPGATAEWVAEAQRVVAETEYEITPRRAAEGREYLERYSLEGAFTSHLQLLRKAKQAVSICVSASGWTEYADRLQ